MESPKRGLNASNYEHREQLMRDDARDDTADANEPDSPDFEASLARLEEIVHQLEQGELGLNESLQRYEEGVARLRECQQARLHRRLRGAAADRKRKTPRRTLRNAGCFRGRVGSDGEVRTAAAPRTGLLCSCP